jgi:hypothetical protein
MSPEMLARHAAIRSRVHFSDAMPGEAVAALLEAAGFVDVVIDRRLSDIHLAQARKMPLLRALERLAQDRFAICATRPQLQTDPAIPTSQRSLPRRLAPMIAIIGSTSAAGGPVRSQA